MKKLICAALLFTSTFGIAQTKNGLWKKNNANQTPGRTIKSNLPQKNLFDLDLPAMKTLLAKSPKRDIRTTTSNIIITLPNGEGKLESYKVFENPVMDPVLAAKYPEIKSYIAVGIENPMALAYFSVSPLGFKATTYAPNHESTFIEPVESDSGSLYTVYKRSEHEHELDAFECSVAESTNKVMAQTTTSVARGSDDGKLRTFRLALSCTAEYAAYFGGSKANTLAAMNNTITRVNGVFERDFGVRLILIANNDALIYTNPTTDPFSDFANKANWKTESQSNLTAVIGEANYDIGHLLGAGTVVCGDAGATGSVCADNYKGRAYSCANSSNYQGDTFDINCVAHEIGHQFGASHTYTYSSGAAGAMEPGSGSTIMGYAGVTMKDVQQNADAYFHAISIQQVTDLIKTKTCPTITLTGNATPIVNAGLDYTIPKGTPFMLTGSATDSNTGDLLTYNWEQMDLGSSTTTVPSATATTGPLFRSYLPTVSPIRYFPTMNSILAGSTTTAGRDIIVEALPGVARTLNFRLTVRDNRIGGGANNTDDVVVTVNGVAGPFTVDTQNTAVSYAAGTSQTVNWTVAGTNANGINAANVDILLSTDGGQTFSTVLISGTPNDGTQNIVIPNLPGTTNRIMVKGSYHIFFDVNNANFTITGAAIAADATAPTASILSASGTTASSTNLSWTTASDNVGVTNYDVYQNGVLKTTTSATTLTVTGLTAATTYTFYVKAKDAAGNVSAASNTVTVTTPALADTTVPSASTLSASGTTASSTNLSWTVATDNVGVTGYNIYQNGVLKTTSTTTSITMNGLTASTAYNFYIKAKDAAGNLSSASNTVNITTTALTDTTAPTTSTLTASGTTASSTNLTWTTATDNAGVTGYNVYQNGALKTTTTATSMTISGLSAATSYTFYVAAKDAAGNLSSASNTVNVTTSALSDTTAPTASTLTASGTTASSTNLTWTAATDNIGVTGYNVYQNGVLKTSTTGTSISITGLSAATSYNFYVKAKDAAGNISTSSNTVYATTLSTGVTYCNSNGGTTREYINRVQMGTIDNTSGNNNGYGNFISLSTSVYAGSRASITITPGWYGAAVNEGYNVWIDFNQNGNFESSELVFSKSKSKSPSVSGNFIIPSTALNGTTRMRVSMKYNATATACEIFTNGEVEDYSIDIYAGSTAKAESNEENLDNTVTAKNESHETTKPTMKVYPNPVKDGTLYFSGLENNATYAIFNLMGQKIGSGVIVNNSINVETLKAGNYIIEVTDGSKVASKRFIKQ